MRYATEIRLARAARLLRSTDATLVEIARLTGYRSEEALGRAFKARFGEPPGVFRRSGGQTSVTPPGTRSAATTNGDRAQQQCRIEGLREDAS